MKIKGFVNMQRTAFLKILIVVSLFLLTGVGMAGAADAKVMISEADSAYSHGEYARAVELYEAVAKDCGMSSQLCYNLGNAYARGGDYGNALINYIRAERLDPSNKFAKENARYIEAKVYDSNRAELKGKKLTVDRDTPSFFSNVKRFIGRDHLSNTWAVWAALAFVLCVACEALYIFTKIVTVRKIGFFGAIICLGISVVTLTFAFVAADYRTNEGVLTAAKVKLRTEPSASAKELASALTRGTRMSVLDSVSDGHGKTEYYKVRLNSDFIGWVEAGSFRTIGL